MAHTAYVEGQPRHDVPIGGLGASRDPYWRLAFELVRVCLKGEGQHCVACGGYLWSRADRAGRLYCDDRCRRRHLRRRERYRKLLAARGHDCLYCGHPPMPAGHTLVTDSREPMRNGGTHGPAGS